MTKIQNCNFCFGFWILIVIAGLVYRLSKNVYFVVGATLAVAQQRLLILVSFLGRGKPYPYKACIFRQSAIQKKYVEGKILLHLYLDYQENSPYFWMPRICGAWQNIQNKFLIILFWICNFGH